MTPFVDNIEEFIEELREGTGFTKRERMSDTELFNSLTTRLRGHMWAGVAR